MGCLVVVVVVMLMMVGGEMVAVVTAVAAVVVRDPEEGSEVQGVVVGELEAGFDLVIDRNERRVVAIFGGARVSILGRMLPEPTIGHGIAHGGTVLSVEALEGGIKVLIVHIFDAFIAVSRWGGDACLAATAASTTTTNNAR